MFSRFRDASKRHEKKHMSNKNSCVNSDQTKIMNANINPVDTRNDQEKPAKDALKESPIKKSREEEEEDEEEESNPKHDPVASTTGSFVPPRVKRQPETAVKARSFTFSELVKATEHFKEENLIGQGGFGRVYKGHLKGTGEVVAIKRLDIHGCQGIREFVVEVMTLSMADHPNLVKLIGYCVEGEQRLLVYEFMPLGSLEDHLFGNLRKRKKLDWNIRMKIAAGAAQGLQYLHVSMDPPIIYRDVKCSNILLGEDYHSKLSDFGLAKIGPSGDKTHVSTRVMGTYGYCAPDYALTGQLTFKSDIYSFGVVLLEILTGRRAIDHNRPSDERNLVDWARPLFKDRKKFRQMADPTLDDQYPTRGLYQTLAICAMCLQELPNQRPAIHDIVHALTYLASKNYNKESHSSHSSRASTRSPTPSSSLSPSPALSPSPSSQLFATEGETKT